MTWLSESWTPETALEGKNFGGSVQRFKQVSDDYCSCVFDPIYWPWAITSLISWDPGIDYQIRYHLPQVSYKCPGPLCPGTVDLCIDVLFPTVFCFPTKFCIECFDFLVKQDFLSLKKVEGEVIFNPLKKTLAWPGRSALYWAIRINSADSSPYSLLLVTSP